MIDITKNYQTVSGKRVIGLNRVPRNSAGKLVTFPIKGSVVVREKPFKSVYEIWTDDGICDLVWNSRPQDNLKLVE